jgi:S-adenosylmethionine decarboxylase
MAITVHILGELYGVEPLVLQYVEHLEPILRKVIERCRFNVLDCAWHQFAPYGVTAFFLLAESHLSVHTWPEESLLTLDIFTCGSRQQALQAFDLLVQELAPRAVETRILHRGKPWKSRRKSSFRSSLADGKACGKS